MMIPNNILVACAFTLRKDRLGNIYNTLPFWIKSVSQLSLSTYILFNDYIPDIDILSQIKAARIITDSITLGFPPDERDIPTRILSTSEPYLRFALTRNKILEYAIDHGYSHLLSIDSDVLVPPDITQHLISIANNFHTTNADSTTTRCIITASVVNNSARDGVQYPNAIYNFGVDSGYCPASGKEWEYGKVIDVTYAGACSLIDLAFIERNNIRYTPDIDGEDWSFCKQIRKSNGRIVVSTSPTHEAFHIQEPHLYEQAEQYLKQTSTQKPFYPPPTPAPKQWGFPNQRPNHLNEICHRSTTEDIPYKQISDYLSVPVEHLKTLASGCPITQDVFHNLWTTGNLYYLDGLILYMMTKLARERAKSLDPLIFEAGCFTGLSTLMISSANQGKIDSIDLMPVEYDVSKSFPPALLYHPYGISRSALVATDKNVNILVGDGAAYASATSKKYAMCFEDASHEYPATKDLLLGMRKCLVDNGFILIHDTLIPAVTQSLNEACPGWIALDYPDGFPNMALWTGE